MTSTQGVITSAKWHLLHELSSVLIFAHRVNGPRQTTGLTESVLLHIGAQLAMPAALALFLPRAQQARLALSQDSMLPERLSAPLEKVVTPQEDLWRLPTIQTHKLP